MVYMYIFKHNFSVYYIIHFQEEMFKAQILARQLAAKALAKATSKQPSNEYDSDEDTEGGTFEHKQRMAEMQKTLSIVFCSVIISVY